MSHEIFTLSLSAINRLKKAGVTIVYFFGSRASGNYFPFSDFDFGIVIEEDKLIEGKFSNLYNIIFDILSSEFSDELNFNNQLGDRPKIDIAFLQKANPALGMNAIRKGNVLFNLNEKLRANFEENIFKKYNDYIFLQREYEEANKRAFERVNEK